MNLIPIYANIVSNYVALVSGWANRCGFGGISKRSCVRIIADTMNLPLACSLYSGYNGVVTMEVMNNSSNRRFTRLIYFIGHEYCDLYADYWVPMIL